MKFHKLLEEVRDILFHEWDPIGLNKNPLCRNEYDSYATTIVRYLREGADEKKIHAHLNQLQKLSMGLQQLDEARDLRVARQLINLAKKT
jgi:hypothetical protein